MSHVISQIGLGSIGQVTLSKFITAFNDVHVHDTDSAKRVDVESLGAVFHDNVASAVTAADFLLLALPNPVASTSVFAQGGPLMTSAKSGAVNLDLSTIHTDTARRSYKSSRDASRHYVEAPVSDGEPMSAGVDLEAMPTTFAHTDAIGYRLENDFAPRIRMQNDCRFWRVQWGWKISCR